jgi:arginyl-tRNA synthetase
MVVFPMLKCRANHPNKPAADLGSYLTAEMPEVKEFNVIKGFLNLTVLTVIISVT